MTNTQKVIDAAIELRKSHDDEALEVLIGKRSRAIDENASLGDDLRLAPEYEAKTMGTLEDLKALGQRIINRWDKELHGVVCGKSSKNKSERQKVLDSLSLNEAAVIAAVVTALLSLGVAAALAAAVAPVIVRRFIWPAKDELCDAWDERLKCG